MNIVDFSLLFKQIDRERSPSNKIDQIISWTERQPEIKAARIICFNDHQIGRSADIGSINQVKEIHLFPGETSILNSSFPLPSGLFPPAYRNTTTVFCPFFQGKDELLGALLLKCDYPRKILKKYSRELEIISSKIGDVIQIGYLRKKLLDMGKPAIQKDILSPNILGRLMNLLELPMYIMDNTGNFIFVNTTFLNQFQYKNIEELNLNGNFFLERDDWARGIQKVLGFTEIGGYAVKVCTGEGNVRVVQDLATLIGKSIFGVLFDITNFINIQDELQETIETQKLLNEKLMATTSTLRKTQSTAMKSLAKLAEYRDMETGSHLQRICEFNKCICKKIYEHQPYNFTISEDYINDIYLSGMLHDIGKVGVPDQILLKPDSLSPEEWKIMKKHTEWGWNILNQADRELGEQSFLTLASRIALSHHERYDGSGYPRNLKEEDIPLSARIASLSDVYDALTSKRPYKEAWTHEQAMEEIVSMRGKQFDPVLVEIICGIEQEFSEIKLNLSDYETAN
ncbi:MAG: hypothetical protein DRP87_03410 [Spirochaetes bacterium]|nr:MAG: hypothetical protein DRP87_03410 [Spirochaetota bacterium]